MTTTTANDVPATVDAAARGSANNRWLWAVLGALFLLPFFSSATGLISNYTYLQLSLMIVYAIAVLGLNLLTGFNGQISLGHGAFFAIGAYAAAILIDQYNWPYWATLPVAAATCFVAGYLFGLPALRLEGHYLALATFSLAIAVPQILKYRHFESFTGGVQGINLVKPDAPFGLPLSSDQWMFLVVLAVAIAMFRIARNLIDSRTGRALTAIRDQALAASTMGINTSHYKAVTFGISALYTGVSGALFAIIFEFVSPDAFRFELSISFLVGMVVGGIASLPGAIFGGIFVEVIEKYADAVARALSSSLHLPIDVEPWTIYGLALILLVFVMPTGIAGGLATLVGYFRRRLTATAQGK
jgi:branched-chain amino acid transport system permease protein